MAEKNIAVKVIADLANSLKDVKNLEDLLNKLSNKEYKLKFSDKQLETFINNAIKEQTKLTAHIEKEEAKRETASSKAAAKIAETQAKTIAQAEKSQSRLTEIETREAQKRETEVLKHQNKMELEHEKSLNRMARNVESLSDRFLKVSYAAGQIQDSLAPIDKIIDAIGSKVATFFSDGLQAGFELAQNMEMAFTGLSNMFGELEATTVFANMKDLALNSSLSFERLQSATVILGNVSNSGEQALDIAKKLGNALTLSGVSTEKLDKVARNFTQLLSSGVNVRDLRELVNDVPIIQKKLNELGLSIYDIKDYLDETGQSAEEFLMGMLNGLPDGLEAYNNTLKGTLERVRESIVMSFSELFMDIGSNGVIDKPIISALKNMLNTFEESIPELIGRLEPTLNKVADLMNSIDWQSVFTGIVDTFTKFVDIGISFAGFVKDTLFPVFEFFGNGDLAQGIVNFTLAFKGLMIGLSAIKGITAFAGGFTKLSEMFSGVGGGTVNLSNSINGLSKWAKTLGEGVLIVAGIAVDVMLLSEAIKQFNEKVPNFNKDVALKMATLGGIVLEMAVLVGAIGGLSTLIGSGVVLTGLGVIALISLDIMLFVKSIEDITSALNRIQELKFNKQKLRENVNSIVDSMKELVKVATLDMGGIGGAINNWINKSIVSNINKMLNELVEISSNIQALNIDGLNTDKIADNLDKIYDVIDTIGGFVYKLSYKDKIVTEQGNFVSNGTSLIKYVTKIKRDFEKVSEMVTDLKVMIENIQTLNIDTINIDNIGKNLEKVYAVIDEIGGFVYKLSYKDKIVTEQGNFVSNGTSLIKYVVDLKKDFAQITEVFELLKGMISNIQSINLDKLGVDSLTGENNKFDKIGNVISTLKTSIETMISENEGLETGELRNTLIHAYYLFGTLGDVANAINNVQFSFENESITSGVESIKTIIARIKEITSDDITESETILTSISAMIDNMLAMAENLSTVGDEYANNLYTGFEGYGLSEKISSYIKAAIDALNGLKERFYAIGNGYASSLMNGFKNNLFGMYGAVSSELGSLWSLVSTAYSIGASIGNALSQAFSNNANLTANVGVRNPNPERTLNAYNGGMVQYFSKGGIVQNMLGGIFRRKATDTVPAMLTAGEGIVNKGAMNFLTERALNKLNRYDYKGFMSDMLGKYESVTKNNSNVTNNYNNQKTQDIDIHITGNNNTDFNILTRRMKNKLKEV